MCCVAIPTMVMSLTLKTASWCDSVSSKSDEPMGLKVAIAHSFERVSQKLGEARTWIKITHSDVSVLVGKL